MGVNGTSLQLNTNGGLSFNGLGGSNGQFLSYNEDNVVWASSTIQSVVKIILVTRCVKFVMARF